MRSRESWRACRRAPRSGRHTTLSQASISSSTMMRLCSARCKGSGLLLIWVMMSPPSRVRPERGEKESQEGEREGESESGSHTERERVNSFQVSEHCSVRHTRNACDNREQSAYLFWSTSDRS
jgi:ATP/maltotriose-dependent transcriptional regulator MalT